MVCISSAKILHVPTPFFMGPASFLHTRLADGYLDTLLCSLLFYFLEKELQQSLILCYSHLLD